MIKNTEPTAWDRLRSQFKPDGKGRYKTIDAMKVAEQINQERIQLKNELNYLKRQNIK
jgi:hypothetical protein